MFKLRKWQILLGIIIIIGPIMTGLISQQDAFALYLSNTYFYLCAPFLIIGLFAKIIKAGTFDFFHYSWKKWRPGLLDDTDNSNVSDKNIHDLSASIGTWHQIFLAIGTILLVLSLIFLAVFMVSN